MFKVGDVVRINCSSSRYVITKTGTIGEITKVYSDNSLVSFKILELPENASDALVSFIGHAYDVRAIDIELVNPLYGPHLSPMLSKVRTMYARQQAKGILRY